MSRPITAAAVGATLLLLASTAQGADLCDDAAQIAAKLTGAPLGIMRAIMAQESSGHPWILNIDGESRRFAGADGALQAAAAALKAGARNVDVGCFQISTRHHRAGFRGLNEMLSPLRNALYAGLFLMDLRHVKGDWPQAVACYHSCEPSRGARYLKAVAGRLERSASQ